MDLTGFKPLISDLPAGFASYDLGKTHFDEDNGLRIFRLDVTENLRFRIVAEGGYWVEVGRSDGDRREAVSVIR